MGGRAGSGLGMSQEVGVGDTWQLTAHWAEWEGGGPQEPETRSVALFCTVAMIINSKA